MDKRENALESGIVSGRFCPHDFDYLLVTKYAVAKIDWLPSPIFLR
jgi:hypothetical protein